MSESGRSELRSFYVALGVVVAGLLYGASLALQRPFPAVKELLAIELGPGIHPTYYLRCALSILGGGLIALLGSRLLQGRELPAEKTTARVCAALVGLAALLVVLYP